MRRGDPLIPLESTSYPTRPMSSRKSTGGPCAPNMIAGALVQLSSATISIDASSPPPLLYPVATFPAPLPYAQDLSFVAYWVYEDGADPIFDSADWSVVVDVSPRSSNYEIVRGRALYRANPPSSNLWSRVSSVLPGVGVGEDELAVSKVVESGAWGDDSIKALRFERFPIPTPLESNYMFARARLASVTAVSKMVETATLVIEAWVNRAVWYSEANPYYTYETILDPSLSVPEYWSGLAVHKKSRESKAALITNILNDRVIDVFGSKDRYIQG